MTGSEALLLMGHGTRDPEGVDELLELLAAVRHAAPGCRVEAGVLEFPSPRLPSIEAALDRLVDAGVIRLAALPLLLHEGGHSKHDIPEQLLVALERHPGLQVHTCTSLGIEPPLLEIVEERARTAEGRARTAEGRLPSADPSDTALLLVGRGSSDPGANADFFKIGRFIWERNHYGWVECCFVSLTEPRVSQGIERCVRLGARRVVVVPYFLSTGVLVKRIASQVAAADQGNPEIELAVGKHLGVHPKLVQMLVARALPLSQGPSLEPQGVSA